MELPIEVMLVISMISSVIVWVLRVAFINQGKAVPAWVYTVLLYVVSLGVTVIFFPVQLPPFPPFNDLSSGLVALLLFLGELLPVLSAFVGAATVIYQIILKRVLDGLGNAVKRLLARGSDIG